MECEEHKVIVQQRPYDPVALGLSEGFRLTAFTKLKG